MDLQEQAIYKLRETLEQTVNKQIKTPKDYDCLSALIHNKTNQTVSASTLKRIFSYYPHSITPRRSTLNVLSRYLGYSDWNDFCNRNELYGADIPEEASDNTDSVQVPEDGGSTSDADTQMDDARQPDRAWRKYVVAAFALVVLLLLGLLYVRRSSGGDVRENEMQEIYILRKGQKFDSYEEYLKLFGITTNTRWWHQRLPHHDRIWIWGPRYKHPEWHNEGNADELMPTITEYWEPPFGKDDPQVMEVVSRVAHEGYYTMQNLNEVRVTFMSGLENDSTFTFLGVYRMSLEESDTTRIVWERVADECNLLSLDYLERFCR